MNENEANIAKLLQSAGQPVLTKLAPSLVKAWGEIGAGVAKDANNPHFGNDYATLSAVLELTKPILARHGLALIQSVGELEGEKLTVITLLLHESGEHLSLRSQIPAGKLTAQAVGSAVTYLRRYQAMAICGLAPVDDDGEAASAPKPKEKAKGDAAPVLLAIEGFKGTLAELESKIRPLVEELGDDKVNKAYVTKKRAIKEAK